MKAVKKIVIKKISKKVFTQKGFDERGCYGCDCKDLCCRHGCDVDFRCFEEIFKNRRIIEKALGKKLEDCFEKRIYNSREYLGGKVARSKKLETGFCAFHNKEGKGCVLYKLVSKKKISRVSVPSICRLFPISWGDDTLYLYNEEDGSIPKSCNIFEKQNKTKKSIFETQEKEIKDIFEFK